MAADPDRERRRERQVGADGPRQRVRAGHLRHEGEEDADEDGSPRQVLREQALDDRRHQRRLRRRELRAADAVRLAHRVGLVEQEERPADDERRGQHADDEADLLAARRRADEVARSSGPATSRRRWPPRCRRSRRRTAPPPGRRRRVRPSATKTTQVAISVAIVMPEIGFDEVPMMPTMREDTVTKKNPKTTTSRPIRSEPGNGPCGKPGRTVMSSASTSEPTTHDPHAEVALGAHRALRLAALAERLHRLAEGRRRSSAAS